MKITAAFPSRYLKAADIPTGRSIAVGIRKVVMEGVESDHGPAEDKPVVYFEDKQKGLVLNRTNASVISESYGDETDVWIGKPLEIYATQTEFRGQMVPCLRLRIPAAAPAVPPVATPQDVADADAIPF